jgi:hypothetical protein
MCHFALGDFRLETRQDHVLSQATGRSILKRNNPPKSGPVPQMPRRRQASYNLAVINRKVVMCALILDVIRKDWTG